MTVKIVTDSTCDLPESLVARYGITVIPLYIHFGQESYLDGVEITREDFYLRLPASRPLPTTAAPASGVFQEVYESLLGGGATGVLSIHISGDLSGTINSARLGAEHTESHTGGRVAVFDSGQLSLGVGFQVLAAAQAANRGQSLDEILAMLEAFAPRVHLFAHLDTMEFLRRSGRVNSLVAGLGDMLQIKPILKMTGGKASSERMRTSRRAMERVIRLAESVAPLDQVAIVHANAPKQAGLLARNIRHLIPEGDDILLVEITPVIGTHIGPGAVGLVCVSDVPDLDDDE